jgi:hypothetical protein
MRGCDAAGFDQRAGSASFCSRAASELRRRGASKILPQTAHFFADGSVEEFEVLKHDSRIAKKRLAEKRLAKRRLAKIPLAKKRLAEKRIVEKG